MLAAAIRAGRGGTRRRVVLPLLIVITAGLSMLAAAPQEAAASSEGALLISAGGSHSCAIEGGNAYCWGSGQYGELGAGRITGSAAPVAVDTTGVLAGKTLTQIAAGTDATCALDSTGTAYCWGDNNSGQLGDGSSSGSNVPVAVDTNGVLAGKTLIQITLAGDAACALDSAGAAYCWGQDGGGELGNRSTSDSDVPVAVDIAGVLAGKTLTQIAAGTAATCALDSTGTAYCWGDNNYGQLGDGNSGDSSGSDVPVAVDTAGVLAGKTLTQITGAGLHTCALDTAGAAFCWGYNVFGELGNGSTNDSAVPVAVNAHGLLAGKKLTSITAGSTDGGSTCAADTGGAVYCWGDDYFGELGNGDSGDNVNAIVPVAVDTTGVLAGETITQITTAGADACALGSADTIYCWGDNSDGQLGDGSFTTDSNVPVLAGPEAPTGVTAVPGQTTATVSWQTPASLDGGTLTGYTATSSPGGGTCSTPGAATCTISGLATGTAYSVTVIAHTTAGDSGTSAPASVTPGSGIAFTSGSSEVTSFGQAFSVTVSATGSPAPKMTKSGRLPPGLRFTAHSGGTATMAGTPSGTAAGPYPVTLRAENKNGTATQVFILTVTRAPAVRPIPATTVAVGAQMHLVIAATGYPAPALAESGANPEGLDFTDTGNGIGVIEGTLAPGSGGNHRLSITATNASGTGSRVFTLKVNQPPDIVSPDSARAVAGSAFRFLVTATGFPPPKITESGPLPAGLTFRPASGAFLGTPEAGTRGRYPLTITAENAAGTVTQNFTLTVS